MMKVASNIRITFIKMLNNDAIMPVISSIYACKDTVINVFMVNVFKTANHLILSKAFSPNIAEVHASFDLLVRNM